MKTVGVALEIAKLKLLNTAGTFLNVFATATTAARTWTLPDKDGTVAMTSDITGGAIGKNYLHNSNFAINQLALTGTVTLAANSKDAHDRFKAGASGCTYTFATASGKTTFTISAGNLIQTVNALDLPSGTNTMCLSFGGTSTGKIGTGTAGASGVTGSVVGGANLDITFSTGTLWEVKLEKGSTPTAYEQPNYAQEMANSLLYFEVFTYNATDLIGTGVNLSTVLACIDFTYSNKIVVPSISSFTANLNYITASAVQSVVIQGTFIKKDRCLLSNASVYSGTSGYSCYLFCPTGSPIVLKIDARL